MVVIGGGNVAMDAARCALRLGADEVSIVYRRSEAEMPARPRGESKMPRKRASNSVFLTNPTKFLGDARLSCWAWSASRWSWASPTPADAAVPVPIPGSEFELDVDTVIYALGTKSQPRHRLHHAGPQDEQVGLYRGG